MDTPKYLRVPLVNVVSFKTTPVIIAKKVRIIVSSNSYPLVKHPLLSLKRLFILFIFFYYLIQAYKFKDFISLITFNVQCS